MSVTDPSLLDTVHDDTLGRLIDKRYRVESILGQGGLGRVYAATDERLDRQVAIKVLLAEHAETPSLRARFEREAKALSALSHPNIVTITDFGLDGERAFVVMEHLPGQDLAALLTEGRPGLGRALGILRGVLSALAYAHGLHIVHRDLKPSNVIVRSLPDGNDHVAVLDFGLAKFLDAEESSAAITRQGAMVGTPAYMSPEQACGVPADARSDVFSAGLLLYELLVGKGPFAECTGPELLRRRLVESPPPLADAAPHLGHQPELQAILDRALSPEVGGRYADAREMLQALDALPMELLRSGSTPLPGAAAAHRPSTGSHAAPAHATAPAKAPPVFRESLEAPGASTMHPEEPPAAPGAASSRGRFVLGLVVVIGLAAAVAFVVIRAPEEEAPVTAPATAPRFVESTTPPPAPAPVVRPPPRDPWRNARGLDELVSSTRDRLNRGGAPSRRTLRRLAAYANNHPNDPLPRLLLGRGFEKVGWLQDALPELERALIMDPSVRGDPHLLPMLIRMMDSASYHAGAAALIRTHYGDEARPALRAAIESGARPASIDRLRALEANL
jgi:serine/threonine protein kinase